MPDPLPLKYRAFISYSHADTGWARWLHRSLESFVIDKDLVGRDTSTGKIPEELRPVFRDRDDFTAGKNGNVVGSLPLSPPAAASVLDCPKGQKATLISGTWSDISIEDETSGAFLAIPGSFSF